MFVEPQMGLQNILRKNAHEHYQDLLKHSIHNFERQC
jgi:hypothetical protein